MMLRRVMVMVMILMRMSWAKVGIGAPARKCTGNGAVGAEDCIPGHLLHPPYQYLAVQYFFVIYILGQLTTTVPPDGTHCTIRWDPSQSLRLFILQGPITLGSSNDPR